MMFQRPNARKCGADDTEVPSAFTFSGLLKPKGTTSSLTQPAGLFMKPPARKTEQKATTMTDYPRPARGRKESWRSGYF